MRKHIVIAAVSLLVGGCAASAPSAASATATTTRPTTAATATAPAPHARQCASITLAIRTVTGHEADQTIAECGLPMRGSWECGQPAQWGQPAPDPSHPWLCWRVNPSK